MANTRAALASLVDLGVSMLAGLCDIDFSAV
jgi:hypothetical protein